MKETITDNMTCMQCMGSGSDPYSTEFCGRPAKYIDKYRETPKPLCGIHGRSVSRSVARQTDGVLIRIDVYLAALDAGIEIDVTHTGRVWEAVLWNGPRNKCTVAAVYHTPPDDNFWNMILGDIESIMESRE